MQVLQLRITARAPLAFPKHKPGTQFRASLPYVPGAALYGALGMWFGERARFESELFRQLRCHNAYPAMADDHWVRPLPATAIQPKGGEGRGLPRDSLYERICWEQQQPAALIYAPTDEQGRPWEAVGSKFYTVASDPYRQVQQRVLTRVGINRRRGTAEYQRLYSLLALNEVTDREPTQFLGSLVCLDGRETDLRGALQSITHLGGRQTTGLGAVEVTSEHAKAESPDDIAGRVAAMTERFRRQAELYTALGGSEWPDRDGQPRAIEPSTVFTVNLVSDAILLEQGWLPTNELSAAMLEELTGIQARLVRAFATTSIVGGWNVSWQRPKQTDVVVTMGSLFVFQAEKSLTGDDCARLAQLQLEGIGERRAEGYGQVRICDEFHLQTLEETQ